MLAVLLALCLGMNQYWINDTQKMLEMLNPPCWYDWGMREEYFYKQEYSPMIWRVTNARLLQAGELAIKYPGKTWFVYNEPEGKDQANTPPELAADWFDKAYKLIKSVDPSASVGCCGIMLRNEGITWQNTFNQTVTVKPDFYHIHIYALTKTDWKSFIDYWHYYNVENVPTYITETCGMYSNDQTELLNYVANYKHPNIKQIYWFGAYPQEQWNCALLNNNELTYLGELYQQNNPTNLTPTPEPVTPTSTPIPTNTPTPVIQPLPTETNTPIPEDDSTNLYPTSEPIFYVYVKHLPISYK